MSSVLGSKQEMTTLRKLSHSLKRHQQSLFSHLFPLFSGVAGPRPGSTAPMSYEGSQFPDACDLHASSQTAARHLQPQLRNQTAFLCSGSLFSHWELLLRKVPSKPGTHSPSSQGMLLLGTSAAWRDSVSQGLKLQV